MLIEDVAELEPIDRLVYWVKERHSIFLKRNQGLPRPWTDDKILQTVFFTNPYRENDKVTQWFRTNFRDRQKNSHMVIFGTIAFRWFNYIPTGKILLGTETALGIKDNHLLNWQPKKLKPLLRGLDKVFTGAFNISNSGSTKNKIDRVCDDYIDPVWAARAELIAASKSWNTMEEAHKYIRQFPGLGGSGFMAYEVVCDLRYTNILHNATDKCSWSNPGPGAKRGLNRILGRPIESPLKPREWQNESLKILKYLNQQLPDMPRFEMREVEHISCEVDKYERARTGDGRVKRMFRGR